VKKNKKNDKIRWDKYFDNRLTEWYSIRQLSKQYWVNFDLIWKNIKFKLDTNPIYQIDLVFDNVRYIMIDWTWITRKICLIIYYDYINKKVIRFTFCDSERYEYIKEDLEVLKNEFKYKIEWFVLDWSKAIIKAVMKVYPEAKIQRCLTHIHRQARNKITRKPKTKAWKELKKLITFKDFNNEKSFVKKINLWEEKHKDFINEKTYKWKDYRYTHPNLRSARIHILNAVPYMFHYLYDENIKKSNNDLESLNWTLSNQINRHKWLRIDRLISFISLWIYERNLREK
jgi:hypothetical protein